MGMFDSVKCDYPLPGTKLEFVKEFQSKDFDCVLAEEKITEEGRLKGRDHFTGTITFYGSNIVSCGPTGQYTNQGEDAEIVTYEASFIDGQLNKIEQTQYERYPALASREMPHFDELRKGSELNEDASFLGQKLYVLWGGHDKGYEAEVVYETDRELCVKNDKGRLELMHRCQIGRTIFKDAAEATADREYYREQIEREKAEYKRKLSERG